MELISEGEHRRLLLWEAAEGGTGVWERIMADPGAFADLARAALEICHIDPATGLSDPAWDEGCTLGCYDCLLSYSNQSAHRVINRHLVRDYLLRLMHGVAVPVKEGRDTEAQYAWLCERIDPASSFEREVLAYLYTHQMRLLQSPGSASG